MSKSIQAGEAYVRLSVRGAKNMERSLNRAQRMLSNFSREAMRIGTAAGAMGTGLALALKPAIASAAKWENAMFRANSIFKDGASSVVDWATKTGSAMGRSRRGVLDFTTTATLMFQNLGVSSGRALSMAQDLAKRSILFANLSGISAEDMQTRFVRALSGSAEVLDQFGVNLKENALKMEQLRQGIPVSEFNEFTKIVARYNLLVKDTNVAMDAGSPNTYLDAVQRLSAGFEKFKEELGDSLRGNLKLFFNALEVAFKEISKRPALLKQIAVAAVGAVAALAAIGASFLAAGVATSVLVKSFAVLMVAFKTTLKMANGLSAAIGIGGSMAGKGISGTFTGLSKILPGVSAGLKAVGKDIALVQKLQTKKVPMYMMPSAGRAAPGTYRQAKSFQAMSLYTGQGGGYGGKSATWKRTGFGTMSSGVSRTSASLKVLNHRLGQGLTKGLGAAGTAAKGLSSTVGGIITKIGPLSTVVWALSEGFNIAADTGRGAITAIKEGIGNLTYAISALPSIFDVLAKDYDTGIKLLQKFGEIIQNEFEFVFSKVGDAMIKAFERAIGRVLDITLFIVPTIGDALQSLFPNVPLMPKWDGKVEGSRGVAVLDLLGAQGEDIFGKTNKAAFEVKTNRLLEDMNKIGMAYNEKEHAQLLNRTRFADEYLKGNVAGPISPAGIHSLTDEMRKQLTQKGPFSYQRYNRDERLDRRFRMNQQGRDIKKWLKVDPPDAPSSRAFGGLSTSAVARQMKASSDYQKEIAEHTKETAEKTEAVKTAIENMRIGAYWGR